MCAAGVCVFVFLVGCASVYTLYSQKPCDTALHTVSMLKRKMFSNQGISLSDVINANTCVNTIAESVSARHLHYS